MISVEKLNNVLSGNVEAIQELLDAIDVTDIKYNPARKEIRCSREKGRNPSSVAFNVDDLYYKCFSTGESGNIYTLIMQKTGCNFYNTLIFIAKQLQLTGVDGFQKRQYPFGGWCKKINRHKEEPELSMKILDESILQEYDKHCSYMFFKDGISYKTQEKYGIGYDFLSDRITVPQRDIAGNLVGVMGRLNRTDLDEIQRWLPVIPCKRGYTLYGFHNNYQEIIQRGTCFIGESEKFVMQLDTMGIPNALATCGFGISQQQARRLKKDLLGIRNYVICYDEGLSEDDIRAQCEKLQNESHIYKSRIGYVWDPEGDLLPHGSKAAPSDFGIDVFKELVRTKTKWLE